MPLLKSLRSKLAEATGKHRMSEEAREAPETQPEAETQSTRSLMGTYLEDQLLKGKLMLQHSLGLGAKPNVIPPGEVDISGEPRTVKIGWHPVAGFAGKWFAERTGLGKMITEEIRRCPDPTQHWAVLVDGYVHQLWMDEHLDIIYINEKLVEEEWHTFEVGQTRFSDEALRQAGEMTIFKMRDKQAAYNLISNNCQNFAINLLDAIQIGKHREFATSFAVYQKAIGKGTVKELFLSDHPEEQPEAKPHDTQEGEHAETVQSAQQVMEDNTTKLDDHHSIFHNS